VNRREFIRITGAGTAAGILLSEFPAAAAILGYSDLQYHKITDIKFTTVRLNFPRPVITNSIFGTSQQWLEESVNILYTDKGATGWGVTRGTREQALKIFDILRGKPLSDLISLSSGVTLPELTIFDFSLFDLAGKITRKPVYQLLGKRRPDKYLCYSTFIINSDDPEYTSKFDTPDNIIQEFRKDYDIGYRQFKLVSSYRSSQTDKEKDLENIVKIIRLVTEIFPDCDILIDGKQGFTIDEFLRYMEGIDGIKLYWIESPFKKETIDDYVKLYSWLRVHNMNPLLAGGNINPDETVLRQLGAQKIIDVFTHDILKTGLTGWIKLIRETGNMGLLASPAAGGSAIRTAYISHLAGALNNTATIEFMACTSNDIDLTGYKIKKGKLIPSSAPGFGMELIKRV